MKNNKITDKECQKYIEGWMKRTGMTYDEVIEHIKKIYKHMKLGE